MLEGRRGIGQEEEQKEKEENADKVIRVSEKKGSSGAGMREGELCWSDTNTQRIHSICFRPSWLQFRQRTRARMYLHTRTQSHTGTHALTHGIMNKHERGGGKGRGGAERKRERPHSIAGTYTQTRIQRQIERPSFLLFGFSLTNPQRRTPQTNP